MLDDFAAKVPAHLWPSTEESAIPYSELPATLTRWQNPREADALTRVQEEVEETKIILVSRFPLPPLLRYVMWPTVFS